VQIPIAETFFIIITVEPTISFYNCCNRSCLATDLEPLSKGGKKIFDWEWLLIHVLSPRFVRRMRFVKMPEVPHFKSNTRVGKRGAALYEMKFTTTKVDPGLTTNLLHPLPRTTFHPLLNQPSHGGNSSNNQRL